MQRLHELLGPREDAVVAVATPEGELVWASEPGSAGMFGRELSEFERQNQVDFIHPDDRAAFRRKLAAARSGRTVRYRVRARAADGSYVAISSVAWPVETAAGRYILSFALPLEDG